MCSCSIVLILTLFSFFCGGGVFFAATYFFSGTLSSSSSSLLLLLLSTINDVGAVFLLFFLIGAFGGWPGGTYDGGSVIARIGDDDDCV